ncbi:bifunctional diguanylate cyclase/phosphodiesterase [Undibacterium sp. TJN25]|uniref:bifunctional diguanylate cyclase/phosphodiesterase n=1 Tax=Undibacterium sp. TJN25 TaxID=3413056 RepID=UPI003BF2666A
MSDTGLLRAFFTNPKIGAAASAMLVLLAVWVLDGNERQLNTQKQRVEVIEKLSVLQAKLGSGITSTISAARVLAISFATHPDISQDEFTRLAAEASTSNSSIRNVGLIRGTKVDYVYPSKGNERVVGVDYRDLPEQWPIYQRMMQEKAIQVAGPLTLIQGGTGLVVRIPVYRQDKPDEQHHVKDGHSGPFLGSIGMVVDYENLLADAGLPQLQQQINVAIRRHDAKNGHGDVFLGDPASFSPDAIRQHITQEISLPGSSWEMAAEPVGGWQTASRGSRAIEVLGGILSLVVATLSYQWLLRNRLREENERKLIDSEALLRLRNDALSATSQGVIITGTDGRITYANQAASYLAGLPPHYLLGINLADLYGDKVGAFLREDARLQAKTLQQEISREAPDGRVIWLELSVNLVKDGHGKFSQYVCVLREITSKKLAEQELKIAAMAFETQEGIMITDTSSVIVRVNRAFTAITGYEAEEAIGKPVSLLRSGRHDLAFYQQMWQSIAEHRYWSGEVWNRRKNGEVYPERLVISAVTAADCSICNYVGSFTDITEYKISEEKIHQLAFFDPLTDLPNRRLLIDRLGRALASTSRHKRHGAILMIDLDNFKTLNDTRGHNVGDQLLIEIGHRLKACVRTEDTVSRTGGDEFVVVLEELHQELSQAAAQAEGVAEKIRHVLNQPIALDNINYESSGSIGISLFSEEPTGIDELLRRADMAMYQAKALGRNGLRFFDPSMQAALETRTALETDLRHAIVAGEFVLHYQLQVSALGDPIGAEVLLRWNHPTRGLVSPLEFIPLAEETGLILPIGLWVLETACLQIKKWEKIADKAGLQLAVNVSAKQFRQPSFVEDVKDILKRSGANPVLLKPELTESVVLDEVDTVIEKMHALKQTGVCFSLDDFGTGYSSLSYLQRLPLNQLKIDRSFVHNLPQDKNNATIVRTIINLGESLGLNVIAEGVETLEQRDFLLRSGCQAYQGYFFCKPISIAAFEELLDA